MEIIEKIIELLQHYGVKKQKIEPDIDIKSLGIAGNELFDFFKNLGNYYNIDLTGIDNSFNFSEDPLSNISKWIGALAGKKEVTGTITISHLIKVVEKGKWFTPD